MLVLTRKLGESVVIDGAIKIVVVQIKGKQVRLGIQAPKETKVHREEIYAAIQGEKGAGITDSSENQVKSKVSSKVLV